MPTTERNPHEHATRASKVQDLSIAIDQALASDQVSPCSAAAVAYVEAMDAVAWSKAARNAKRPLPSETTKALVIDLYRRRAARAA